MLAGIQSEDELLNIIGQMVENMLMVLTVELYTLERGARKRMAGKSELLYRNGLCISLLNKSKKLFIVY